MIGIRPLYNSNGFMLLECIVALALLLIIFAAITKEQLTVQHQLGRTARQLTALQNVADAKGAITYVLQTTPLTNSTTFNLSLPNSAAPIVATCAPEHPGTGICCLASCSISQPELASSFGEPFFVQY